MAKKEKKCVCPPPGAPGWMTTFADLMSLLMCFFVLLLSFSEIDVMKFQELSGSLRHAFGVQHNIKVMDIPRGTSIIALEFSPSVPQETLVNEIYQDTIDSVSNSLEFISGDKKNSGGEKRKGGKLQDAASKSDVSSIDISNDTEDADKQESYKYFNRLESELYEYVYDGSVQIESKGQEIIISVNENNLFASNSGYVQNQFKPMLLKIAKAIKSIPGQIKISGHTDDTFVSNEIFRSSWQLSSVRSLSVLEVMLSSKQIDPSRFILQSYSQYKPKFPNNTPENRAKNRRVEISIKQGREFFAKPLSAIEGNKDPSVEAIKTLE